MNNHRAQDIEMYWALRSTPPLQYIRSRYGIWNMLSCWQGAWWGQQVLAHQPSVPAHALVAHEAYDAHCSFGEVPYGGACHAISAILESDKKYETRSVWDFTFFCPGFQRVCPILASAGRRTKPSTWFTWRKNYWTKISLPFASWSHEVHDSMTVSSPGAMANMVSRAASPASKLSSLPLLRSESACHQSDTGDAMLSCPAPIL